MKQVLLAIFLIALPVGLFSVGYSLLASSSNAASQDLGDLSKFRSIIVDVQKIFVSGDYAKAEERITDFETAWDDAEAKLRPMNKVAWGNLDDAADAALHALRKSPEAGKVAETLAALLTVIDNPMGGSDLGNGVVKQVEGIAVTDEVGRALACEGMIKTLQTAIDAGKFSDVAKGKVSELQSKALERCNADDDIHADEFSAQALAMAGK